MITFSEYNSLNTLCNLQLIKTLIYNLVSYIVYFYIYLVWHIISIFIQFIHILFSVTFTIFSGIKNEEVAFFLKLKTSLTSGGSQQFPHNIGDSMRTLGPLE